LKASARAVTSPREVAANSGRRSPERLPPVRSGAPVVRQTVTTTEGKNFTGTVINENSLELQLRTDDNRVALLRPSGDRFRPVTSETDWPTYRGDVSDNRYSALAQINTANVQRLAPKWVFNFPGRSMRVQAWKSGIFSAREHATWWATPPEGLTVEWRSRVIVCSWSPIMRTFWP
jgi:hypothetical protein